MKIQSTNRGMRRPVAVTVPSARALKLGATALLLSVTLTACQHTKSGSIPTDGFRTRHPIEFKELPKTLDIPVGMRTSRLNKVQRQKVAAFARESTHKGDGMIQILVPSGSANESTANYVASKIRDIVRRSGVRAHNVGMQAYTVPDAGAVAPIRLAYTSIQASVHRCGTWPDNIADNLQNGDYYEFGCSTQANLAAIISNPADLLNPRASTPGDAARHSTIMDKYRKGEVTSSAKETRSATISDVGDN